MRHDFGPDFARASADLHPQNKDPHRGRSGRGAQNGQVLPFDGGKFFDMTQAMLGKPLPAVDIPPGGRNPSSTSS